MMISHLRLSLLGVLAAGSRQAWCGAAGSADDSWPAPPCRDMADEHVDDRHAVQYVRPDGGRRPRDGARLGHRGRRLVIAAPMHTRSVRARALLIDSLVCIGATAKASGLRPSR